MPNASQRITDTTIKSLNSMLFMFNSLDERTDLSLHPKWHIVINNVSKYGEDYDLEATENNPDHTPIFATTNLSNEKRIDDIKD